MGGEGWQGRQEKCGSSGCGRHTQDTCLTAAQHTKHAQISIEAVRSSAAPGALPVLRILYKAGSALRQAHACFRNRGLIGY